VYGYLHLGRITSFDAASGGFNLQSVGLARTSRWGPVSSAVPGLLVNDRVVLGATGTSRDELVIIAKVGATFPGIPDIPGLTAALAGKADDTEIATILASIEDLSDDLTALESTVSAHTTALADDETRLDALEALTHVRVVDDLADVTAPVTNQLAWLTTDRSLYRWDTAVTPDRWSKSATSGKVIGGKRRTTNVAATSGGTELSVIDTGALDFEVDSLYEIKATLLWQSSGAGDDFVFQIKETSTAGAQRASLVAPRTVASYPQRTEISFLKATGVSREDALTHIASAQRVAGTGTCTVIAGSYVTATYLGPGALLGTL